MEFDIEYIAHLFELRNRIFSSESHKDHILSDGCLYEATNSSGDTTIEFVFNDEGGYRIQSWVGDDKDQVSFLYTEYDKAFEYFNRQLAKLRLNIYIGNNDEEKQYYSNFLLDCQTIANSVESYLLNKSRSKIDFKIWHKGHMAYKGFSGKNSWKTIEDAETILSKMVKGEKFNTKLFLEKYEIHEVVSIVKKRHLANDLLSSKHALQKVRLDLLADNDVLKNNITELFDKELSYDKIKSLMISNETKYFSSYIVTHFHENENMIIENSDQIEKLRLQINSF